MTGICIGYVNNYTCHTPLAPKISYAKYRFYYKAFVNIHYKLRGAQKNMSLLCAKMITKLRLDNRWIVKLRKSANTLAAGNHPKQAC